LVFDGDDIRAHNGHRRVYVGDLVRGDLFTTAVATMSTLTDSGHLTDNYMGEPMKHRALIFLEHDVAGTYEFLTETGARGWRYDDFVILLQSVIEVV